MAASPRYKVFNTQGEYVAACRFLEDAAAIIASYGNGAQIRDGHSAKFTLWTEGSEDQEAGESFDHVVDVCLARQGQFGGSSTTPRQ